MDESGTPWPGLVFRVKNGNAYDLAVNTNAQNMIEMEYQRNKVSKVTFKRMNGILYIKINDDAYEQVLDMSSIIHTFDVPLTFGSSIDKDLNPWRYFKGTLKNMMVIVYE